MQLPASIGSRGRQKITRAARLLLPEAGLSVEAVKLVKHQTNGREHLVLKQDASPGDLIAEVARLQKQLGYQVKVDGRPDRYVVTHPFFRGKFTVSLEPE
jgi:hypothetical protein